MIINKIRSLKKRCLHKYWDEYSDVLKQLLITRDKIDILTIAEFEKLMELVRAYGTDFKSISKCFVDRTEHFIMRKLKRVVERSDLFKDEYDDVLEILSEKFST